VPAAGPTQERLVGVEVDGRAYDVRLLVTEPPWAELARRRRSRDAASAGSASGVVRSPMQGTVLAVAAATGDEVSAGSVVVVIEAMKMENEITAPRSGTLREVSVAPGDAVALGQPLFELEEQAG
jgi:acetyl-CoA/propionyl-CoA carboxylase biotin carboxyl carrier protein